MFESHDYFYCLSIFQIIGFASDIRLSHIARQIDFLPVPVFVHPPRPGILTYPIMPDQMTPLLRNITAFLLVVFTGFIASPKTTWATGAENPQSGYRYEAGYSQQIHFFSRVYETQYQGSWHLGFRHAAGTYLFRLNRAHRFEQTGWQWEFESYPVLTDRVYSYVSYAYSDAKIYPQHRAGIEFFSALPHRMEGSLGMRFFDFDNGNQTWIVTPSLGHYYGPFLFLVRPYFIFSNKRSGQTWTGSARWFLNDTGDYLMIRGALGRSSDEVLFQVGEAAVKDFLLLRSSQAGAEGLYSVTRQLSVRASVDLYRQELSFDPGSFVRNWTFRLGLEAHF